MVFLCMSRTVAAPSVFGKFWRKPQTYSQFLSPTMGENRISDYPQLRRCLSCDRGTMGPSGSIGGIAEVFRCLWAGKANCVFWSSAA